MEMISIRLEPDAAIEPGHQVIVLPYSEEGRSLTRLLTGDAFIWRYYDGREIRIPHDQTVDARIVTLINILADFRYQAPELVQLTLMEPQP
jgi:hypothetical protein